VSTRARQVGCSALVLFRLQLTLPYRFTTVHAMPDLALRTVTAYDADVIARLHALSWRSAYRGILIDAYLDGDILAERQAHWHARLDSPKADQFGFLALLDEKPVGFAFAFPHEDAHWGTNLDNLHVLPGLRGGGIGSRLLHAVTSHVITQFPGEGLYLWVYELNTRTRAYYERLGAQPIERAVAPAPGGGTVAAWCYAWPAIGVLHAATQPTESQ
jgi:GNAT superfamily N-acetyltransferase